MLDLQSTKKVMVMSRRRDRIRAQKDYNRTMAEVKAELEWARTNKLKSIEVWSGSKESFEDYIGYEVEYAPITQPILGLEYHGWYEQHPFEKYPTRMQEAIVNEEIIALVDSNLAMYCASSLANIQGRTYFGTPVRKKEVKENE